MIKRQTVPVTKFVLGTAQELQRQGQHGRAMVMAGLLLNLPSYQLSTHDQVVEEQLQAYRFLGHCLVDITHYDEAQTHYQQALALAQQIHSHTEALIHLDLGTLAFTRGYMVAAVTHYRQAHEILRVREYPVGTSTSIIAESLLGRALIHLDAPEGVRRLQAVLSKIDHDPEIEGWTHLYLAEHHRRTEQWLDELDSLLQAFDHFSTHGLSEPWISHLTQVYIHLAQLYLRLNDVGTAIICLRDGCGMLASLTPLQREKLWQSLEIQPLVDQLTLLDQEAMKWLHAEHLLPSS